MGEGPIPNAGSGTGGSSMIIRTFWYFRNKEWQWSSRIFMGLFYLRLLVGGLTMILRPEFKPRLFVLCFEVLLVDFLFKGFDTLLQLGLASCQWICDTQRRQFSHTSVESPSSWLGYPLQGREAGEPKFA